MSAKKDPVIISLKKAKDPRFGGKAVGLFRLKNMGLNVPEGFCVSGDEKKLKEEITAAYREMGEGIVAVRSSASNEDGGDLSAAGQYESILDVRGSEALFRAINACRASLVNNRAQVYFDKADKTDKTVKTHKNKKEPSETEMTVVVQRMVDAKISGVLFTVEPQSVIRESGFCVVEAVAGAGEQLVSGLVQAEQYKVHRKDSRVERIKEGSLLTDQQLHRLCKEALEAEKVFGKPIDLEWAIDQNGEIFWLQARPITTLLAVGADEFDPDYSNESYYTRVNIGEMMPGAATPLTINIFGDALNCGFDGLYGSCGAIPKGKRPAPFVISFYNHLFIDLSLLMGIVGRVAGTSKEALEISMFGRETDYEPPIRNYNGFLKGINFLRYGSYVMGYKGAIRKLNKMKNRLFIASSEISAEMFNSIDKFIPQYNEITRLHLQVSSFSGALNGALREVLQKGGLSGDYPMKVIASLLLNIDGIESAQIIKELEDIALVAKRETAPLRQKSAEEFYRWITDSKTTESYRRFQSFLEKNGHRCVREAEFSEKEWRDDTRELTDNLWNMMRVTNAKERISEIPAVENTIADLCREYPKVNEKAVRTMAKLARDGVRNREYTKSILILMTSRLRHAYRGIEQLLLKEGKLSQEGEIYFLRHEEIGRICYGSLSVENVRKMISARRYWYSQHENLYFLDFCRGKPVPQETLLFEQGKERYTGLAVSPGKVTATVRVVHTKEDARQLKDGEIMCARFTDVGWTPYYGVIHGLITEIGSSLSHGAVVAREYRLPLVSSIQGATQLFKTGDVVELDGTLGTVKLVEAAAE